MCDSTHTGTWSDPNYPVETVRWYDACDYCNWLSQQHGLTPVYAPITYTIDSNANGYRLPYDKEWEYACRAGTETTFFWGNTTADIDLYCWYYHNSDTGSGRQPHEVTSLNPNDWDLYHMSGNVYEWCNDEAGQNRVIRGGAWNSFTPATYCTSSHKSNFYGPNSGDDIGFRLCRNAP